MNNDPFVTGSAPPQILTYCRPVTEKGKVELWYIEPLLNMKDDEAFICLMVCFPLLETIMRYELNVPDEQDLTLSDDSPALHWFAKFMTISESDARQIWDAFRNGLLHRTMIKGTVGYELTGKKVGRPTQAVGGRITVYVWDFRDKVVEKLREHHKRLWQGGSNNLPKIYIQG